RGSSPQASPSRTDWRAIVESLASLLKDRQISLGHLQNDEAHGGGVRSAAVLVDPAAVGRLTVDEFLADGRPPFAPAVAAGEIHGLHGVIVAVVIVRLS